MPVRDFTRESSSAEWRDAAGRGAWTPAARALGAFWALEAACVLRAPAAAPEAAARDVRAAWAAWRAGPCLGRLPGLEGPEAICLADTDTPRGEARHGAGI